MTGPAPQLIGVPGRDRRPGRDPSAGGAGWLDWLRAQLDPVWRPGEWDGAAKLFTGDLHSDRTAAWPCRTPGCPTATRHHHGRCDGCRRARTGAGLSWEDYDADPPRHPIRPLLPVGRCAVPGCESELHCSGLCLRHEHAWRRPGSTESVADFAARARPFPRAQDCLVAGCAREQLARRGLCRFHDKRYLRTDPDRRSDDGLAGWVAAEQPLLGVHQFCLAGLPELLGVEVLYALQQRDLSPLPMDPTPGADPAEPADRGGLAARGRPGSGLRERRRAIQLDDPRTVHRPASAPGPGLGRSTPAPTRSPGTSGRWRCWACTPTVHVAGRRPTGVVDFRPIELPWLREVGQGLGPHHPALPAAAPGDAARLPGRLPDPDRRRAGGPDRAWVPPTSPASSTPCPTCDGPTARVYSASRRNLLLYQLLRGHRTRPGQRSAGPGPRPVPPGPPPPPGGATNPTRTNWARPSPTR